MKRYKIILFVLFLKSLELLNAFVFTNLLNLEEGTSVLITMVVVFIIFNLVLYISNKKLPKNSRKKPWVFVVFALLLGFIIYPSSYLAAFLGMMLFALISQEAETMKILSTRGNISLGLTSILSIIPFAFISILPNSGSIAPQLFYGITTLFALYYASLKRNNPDLEQVKFEGAPPIFIGLFFYGFGLMFYAILIYADTSANESNTIPLMFSLLALTTGTFALYSNIKYRVKRRFSTSN